MKTSPLFRKEVIDNKRNQNYGSVSINTPVQYTVLTLGFTSIAFLIMIFLIFAEYSEKFIVSGYLDSAKGIVKVYPNKNGIIVKSTIQPGMQVKKGDPLFLIDTTAEGLDNHDDHQLLEQLQHRKQAIDEEIIYKSGQLQALETLLLKKFIPLAVYNEKHSEMSVLKNDKNLIEVDIIKRRQARSYTINSPVDGLVSSIHYKEGQYINLSKPLAKIIPANADLMAELFIPVRQSGFLNENNKIIIRYDAYPYQRFGSYKAVIKSIAQTIMTDEEEDKPIRIGLPYYKVTAKLDSQFVRLYGKEKLIQPGMTVSAVIVGSKRKIWQWILDPIYSFYGGMVL